ncbi:peptidoglycan-binding domain-containing protein [Roseovarius sp.]|uniref:peptidoglycan-binding domain-containing protein n=1 Tax=Roseovarius sp. TaxID=1486281 RepID=UPI002628A59A|nr:peptidoglycan-binding domain-containing protein [Roseovarius sp.]
MKSPPFALLTLMALGLMACESTTHTTDAGDPDLVTRIETSPPGAAPGTCWGKEVAPAVIETVTEQILLHPADIDADGKVARPALYRTETRQDIVKERQVSWFETPCADDLTPDFVASVQRALAARALYRGPISGEMDTRTRAAIRRYQAPEGPVSGILSLKAARNLGLVSVKPGT